MTELLALIQDRIGTPLPLEPDTPLLSSGLVDSFRVGMLLAALEERYKVRIDPADVGADNFDTARQIMHFIEVSR